MSSSYISFRITIEGPPVGWRSNVIASPTQPKTNKRALSFAEQKRIYDEKVKQLSQECWKIDSIHFK